MKLKDRKRMRGQARMLSTVGITLTRIERTLHGKGSPGASLDTIPARCSSIGSSLELQGGCGSHGPAPLGGRRVCMGTRWVDISCNSFVRTAGAAPLPSVEKVVVAWQAYSKRGPSESLVPGSGRARSHFDRRILVVNRDKRTTGSGRREHTSRR
jgi:hypothetical protein